MWYVPVACYGIIDQVDALHTMAPTLSTPLNYPLELRLNSSCPHTPPYTCLDCVVCTILPSETLETNTDVHDLQSDMTLLVLWEIQFPGWFLWTYIYTWLLPIIPILPQMAAKVFLLRHKKDLPLRRFFCCLVSSVCMHVSLLHSLVAFDEEPTYHVACNAWHL